MTAFSLDSLDLEIPAGAELKHCFNAPFYTGFTLDTQALLAREVTPAKPLPEGAGAYERHQAVILEKLGDRTWRDASSDREGRQEFDVDNYSGRPVPPLFFLQRKLDGLVEEASNTFSEGGVDATVTGVDIKVFDFGVGVVTVKTMLHVREALHLRGFRDAVECMASGGNMDERSRKTVCTSLHQLFEALPADWLTAEIGPDGRTAEAAVSDGQALWTHRIYHLPVGSAMSLEEAAHIAWRYLLPPMPEEELNRVVCGDMLFVPEKGSSVALFRAGQDPIALLHTIELQNAYWAGAAKLDRALMRRVAALSYDTRQCNYRELESRTEEVIDFYERVRMFQMVHNSLLGCMSPLQYSTWVAVAESWRLSGQLDAVADKLDALASIHDQLLEDASQRRTGRLNTGVFVFTAFSLAQTLFAAIAFGFMKDGELTTREWLPISITLAIGLACLAVALMLLRAQTIRRGQRRPRG